VRSEPLKKTSVRFRSGGMVNMPKLVSDIITPMPKIKRIWHVGKVYITRPHHVVISSDVFKMHNNPKSWQNNSAKK